MDKRAEDLYRESNDRVGSFHRIQRITKDEATKAVAWLDANMTGWDEELYIQAQQPDEYWDGIAINDDVLYEVFSPAVGLLFPHRQKKGWKPSLKVVRARPASKPWLAIIIVVAIISWSVLKLWSLLKG